MASAVWRNERSVWQYYSSPKVREGLTVHLGFLLRLSRRPAAWAVTLGSLGLAVLSAGPATGWSREVPQQVSESPLEDDLLAPADEEVDAPGSVRVSSDDDDFEDAKEAPGRIKIRNAVPAAPSAPPVRIKDSSTMPTRRLAVAPSQVMAPKPVRASRVNQTAQRYPFEPPVASYRPAAASTQASRSTRRGAVTPVGHQSRQRTPFVNDESDEADELEAEAAADAAISKETDGEDVPAAVATFEEQKRDLEPAEPAPVVGSTDCPQLSEGEIASFAGTIEETIKRRPIGALRADMQTRLTPEHSSLADDADRHAVRERGRCVAERDRAIVRHFYRQKYGVGYDRSTAPNWSDESLAPEFPFCYHPLYFEDANLERCGVSQGCCCQPLVSGFQFYANVALLPIKMLTLHPCSYVYPQCDCEPCTRYSCCDNLWGPRPESLFSPCYSTGSCRY